MVDKDAALLKIEEARVQMLAAVNRSIDSLIARVKSGEPLTDADISTLETAYPLGIDSALFKGTKPTAVYFGDEKVEVKTWRNVFVLVLQRCADIPTHRDRLMHLRNRIMGRSRIFLSDKPDGMDFPIQIADGIYAEMDFDTEWLIRVLTNEILDNAHYDYSHISVSMIPRKKR
jgi:hypothetical protein